MLLTAITSCTNYNVKGEEYMKITNNFLTINPNSRSGIKRSKTTKIAVHYVGNPNTTAVANRNYFENLKGTSTYVSSNYIIGLEGEIICCVPDVEIAYCTNQANSYSVSIECCHPDSTGKFNAATEKSLAELCAYLCKRYNLNPIDDIIRHYDVTGKQCPLYWSPTKYVSREVADARFNAFKKSVAALMSNDDDDCPFKVSVLDDELNIRSEPGTQAKITGVITNHGVYTIVETATVGSVLWGKLKSGIGWISLNNKYVEEVV